MHLDDYGVVDPPEWLEGFSLELVQRLDDLVRAYGVDDPQVAVRRTSAKGGRPVFVTSALTEYRAVMIGCRRGQVDLNRSYICRFDDGYSYVVWQQGVSVSDVQALISELSILESAFGSSVDQVFGELAPGDNQESCVFKVAEHFKSPYYVSVPVPGTDTAEDYRNLFDHPEELAIVETLFGRGVCHRDDVAYILEREEVVTILLQKHGITPEMVPQLAPGELMKVYRVVDRELRRVLD